MDKPLESEVEVTLLGTGGGYGESVVIKLGISSWIIVDCCINPVTGVPLAIEYFEEIGVNYKNDVKQIICTHWHDDHIRGISRLVRECTDALLCVPIISSTKNFLVLVGYDDIINDKKHIKSTYEYSECINIIRERKSQIRKVKSDMRLFIETVGEYTFEICSLSPSDSIIEKFDLELTELMDSVVVDKKSIIHKSPNDKSIALLIKFGTQRVVLGSDLEVGKHPYEGWLDIMNNSVMVDDTKAQVFKIPHHGSENGYDLRIFEKLIHDESVLKLTPWNLGAKLPTQAMLETYFNHSPELYITSNVISTRGKQKSRDKAVEKLVEFANKSVREVKFDKGFVISRFNYLEPTTWYTKTFYSATKVVSPKIKGI